MKRTHIFESGALDLLKDIEAGTNDGVQLSDLAPDPESNEADYNASDDPEMEGSAPLSESYRGLSIRERIALRENRTSAIINFVNSDSSDKSFDAFKESPYYSEASARDGTPCTKQIYIGSIKAFLKDGRLSADNIGNALAGGVGGKSAYSDSDDDDGPYQRGADFDAENYVQSSTLANWASKYSEAPAVTDVNDVFDNMEDIVREIVLGVADKRHACVAGDPGIGKTYTVRQAIERFGKDSGKKIHYSSGAMSPALSSVIPFFYYHRNNEIIILDDNDKCLMKSCDQAVQNIMKALLDPSALKKPVSIPTSSTLTKLFNQQLEILSGMNESVETKKSKNGVRIDIDMEALKEGYFKISVDGVETDAVKINEATKLELSNMIKPTSKLNEAFDDEDEDLDEDGDEALEDDGSAYEIEPSFIFNSSVIFISNLKLKDISPAVADRCECCEIALTLPQFMQRLETVLGGLCKGEAYSSRPQWLRDWGKQTAYTAFQALVEAFNTGTILFGKRVTIRRKLTFRLFEEMANEWCRLASSKAFRQAERNGVKLNLENKKDQAAVADLITEQFIRSLIDKVNQKGSN